MRIRVPEGGLKIEGLEWPGGEISVSDRYWARRLQEMGAEKIPGPGEEGLGPVPNAEEAEPTGAPEGSGDDEVVEEEDEGGGDKTPEVKANGPGNASGRARTPHNSGKRHKPGRGAPTRPRRG